MTLVMGQLVINGAAIAADSLVTRDDGTTLKESKITVVDSKSGIFVIANASENLDSTRTMVNTIRGELASTVTSSIGDLQTLFTRVMTEWYGAFGQKTPPASGLILCTRLNGDKARIFFCEPPVTFIERTEGYAAAGAGASVADPLNDLLFGFRSIPPEIQAALRRMAYLFYRAKEGHALCGRRTHCYVIGDTLPEPLRVNVLEFEQQERISQELDFLVHSAAVFALESDPDEIERNAVGLSNTLTGLAGLRATIFHDTYGRVIRLSK